MSVVARRSLRLLAVAAAVVLAAPIAIAAPGGTLKGTVENEKGKAVAGARIVVEIPGKPAIEATSDEQGEFVLAPCPVGKVEVRVIAKGYFPASEIVVVAGRGATRTSFTLRYGVRFAGKVTDAAGAPVEGVAVRARRRFGSVEGLEGFVTVDELFRTTGPSETVTDASGAFDLGGLSPTSAKYVLAFRHPKFALAEIDDLPGRPGTVKDGLVQALAPAAWVRGTVVDVAGKPIAKAWIGGVPGTDPPPSPGTTHDARFRKDLGEFALGSCMRSAEDGTFLAGSITTPEATLLVSADGHLVTKVALAELVVGQERGDVRVVLEKATASLEGWVLDANGRGVEGAHVRLTTEEGDEAASGNTDEGGNWRFPWIRAKGPVNVTASASGFLERTVERVAPGQKQVRIKLQAGPKIRVKVVDATGTVVPEVRYVVRLEDGGSDRRSSSGEAQGPDGIRLDAPVGRVIVEVTAEGFGWGRAGPFECKAAQVVEGGTITLERK